MRLLGKKLSTGIPFILFKFSIERRRNFGMPANTKRKSNKSIAPIMKSDFLRSFSSTCTYFSSTSRVHQQLPILATRCLPCLNLPHSYCSKEKANRIKLPIREELCDEGIRTFCTRMPFLCFALYPYFLKDYYFSLSDL